MIEISGQYGSESADEKFWPFHRQLNDLFDKLSPNTYSKIIDDIAIIFRVSGEVQDFGTEGPERLFFRKKDRYIVIDLTFPQERLEEAAERDFASRHFCRSKSCFRAADR